MTMHIQLTDERKENILSWLHDFYRKEFDEELSDFRAEQLLEFFVKRLGPAVYNQAIQDARKFVHDKLDDLDAEFYEPEEPR